MLSDAYEGDGDIEVKVTMLNINFGKNRKLLDACKPLYEYSWFVESIRRYQKKKQIWKLQWKEQLTICRKSWHDRRRIQNGIKKK